MNEKKRWVCVTEVENIPLREGRSVHIGGHDIAIFNLGGRFLAVENRCPHKGGPLAEGIVSGANVVCPLHAWKVSLETGALVGNANGMAGCVRTFAVAVHEGLIFLEQPPVADGEGKNGNGCGTVEPVRRWADGETLGRNGAEAGW
jgi:nitrite reductase (NADH) small subunit